MYKTVFIVLLLTIVAVSLFGLHSEDDGFLIGDYSGYALESNAFVFQALQDAHFNVKVQSFYNYNDISARLFNHHATFILSLSSL
ncbi:MAG: hypothetical protein JXR56_02245 [Candidatus Cloacimonetes bacterium]|nr:hypothetical protein [Candidatus Cloacimonadota bacterium]